MSWLNNSLSNIKGQITNFANEVLAEGTEEEQKINEELDKAKEKLIELENIISRQNFEIASLRKQNAEILRKEADKKSGAAAGTSGTQNVQAMEDSWIWTEGDYDAEDTSQDAEKKKRSDSAELKSRIFDLEQENQRLTSSLEELDSQHNIASQKFIEIKNELQKKYDKLLDEMRVMKDSSESEKLKQENERLRIDLDKVQEDLNILQDENFELQKITQDYKSAGGDNEMKKIRDELESLTRKCEDLTHQNERLKVDIDKVDEDRAVLQDDNFTLQDQLAQLRKNAEESNSIVKSAEVLKKENLDLKQQIEGLNKFKVDLEQMKKKDEVLVLDNERLKVDLDKVQEDMSFLQDENFQLQEEIEMLKNSSVPCSTESSDNIESLKKEHAQFRNEIENLQKELEAMKKRESDLVFENDRLKTDQDKIEEDRSVLQDEVFELKDQIDALKSNESLDILKKENSELKKELDKCNSLKTEFEKLKQIEADLKAENERLKVDQDKVEEDRSVLQDSNFELQEQIASLKNDSNNFENLKLKYDELKAEFDKLTQSDISCHQELERLKIDLDKVEEDRSILQDSNFELQDEIATLKNNSSSYETLKQENLNLKNQLEKSLSLTESNSALNKQIEMLMNAKTDLQQDIERLKVHLDKVEEDRSILQDANFELQAQVDALKDNTTLEALKQENMELKKEIEKSGRLKIDYEKLEEDLCVLQDQNFGYQGDIVNLNGKIQQHLSEIDTLKQKISLLSIQSKDGDIKEEMEQYDRLKIDFDKVQEDYSVLQDENFELQQKIKDIQKENAELQQRLSGKSDSDSDKVIRNEKLIKELQEANITLTAEKQAMSLELAHYEKECANLMKNYDKIYLELEEVKSSKLETISEKNEESFLNLEQQLENCSSLNQSLEDQYKNLEEQLEHAMSEKKKLEENLNQAQTKIKKLKMEYEQEKSNLLFELNELKTVDKSTLQELEIKCKEYEAALQSAIQGHENLLKENSYLKQELQRAVQNLEGRNSKIQILDSKSGVVQQHHMDNAQLGQLRSELQTALDTIESLKTQNIELYNKSTTELQNQKAIEITLRHEVDQLRQHLSTIDSNKNILDNSPGASDEKKYLDLKNKYEHILKENENLKVIHQQTAQLEAAYTALTSEKNELIKVLKGKHEENVTYHAEIQRLNALLQTELAKAQAQSQGQGQVDPGNLEKLTDQIAFLREKCDILTNSLVTEQTNVKLLNQEKREAEEKATASFKELERLRQHLVEIENSHTQEIMELDMRNNELQTKISSIEEHAIYNNTAYTSASIRANQQAETLQTQLNLMSQQRDELLAKMSDTEDKYNRQVAALTNLQCALEQFQRDKDQEIHMCTERIRGQLEMERKEQTALRNELQSLRTQLSEQQQGLMAAGRLASQLESSQSAVQSLRQELKESQDKFAALNAKVESNKNNQADKIEKSLVKNLMLGYITAGQQNDKAQILKIISAVLDFNQSECDRIGLLNSQKSSWFGGSILRLGEEGLAKAFVEFLEKESLPRQNRDVTGGPSLLQIEKERRQSESKAENPIQGATGNAGAQPASSQQSTSTGNALLSQATHENMLPTFAPPRSASSILKDVLKDNNT